MSVEIPKTESQELQRKRKKLSIEFWGICFLLLIVGLLFWYFILRVSAYTNDAYVEGNQVFITPLKSGFITSIHTDETFLVKKGQLLISLDETDAKIALAQAQQDLAYAVREVCQAFHQVFAYQAEMETRLAELIRTVQDYKHREDVLTAAGVSIEDFEHAVAALRAGYYSFKTTEANYDRALAFIQGASIKEHPLVQRAADILRNMWVQLYRCKIYSPVEGLAAQRKIQVGMWVNAGQPMMSVIPLDQIWLNANFKETQMRGMKIGQKVRIISDLYGSGVVFNGIILGLPGAAGNAFSLLPPQNLSGNWIKIVQRLPVRVGLDPSQIKQYPLRIGLSMEATVDLEDQNGLLVPTTTEGSPTYQTTIFEAEEAGDREMIGTIVDKNLDPTLLQYAEASISIQKTEIGPELNEYVSRALLRKNISE